MGEQPIFTCKAHVFHIDQKTKKSWISASSSAVNVSFFFDAPRNLYRIISVEKQRAIINSTMTPTMQFAKTSQKFGQWSDIHANTVYGLGFASEQELNTFIDKFEEVRQETRNVMNRGSVDAKGIATTTTVVTSQSSVIVVSTNSALSGSVSSAKTNGTATTLNQPHSSFTSTSTNIPVSTLTSSPSKKMVDSFEGQGGKLSSDVGVSGNGIAAAAAQVAANNGNVTVTNITTNQQQQQSSNKKTTQTSPETLQKQDTTANIYKHENEKLRSALSDSLSRVTELEKALSSASLTSDNTNSTNDVLKTLKGENISLSSTVEKLRHQLETSLSAQSSQKRVLEVISKQLGDHITALYQLQQELCQSIANVQE